MNRIQGYETSSLLKKAWLRQSALSRENVKTTQLRFGGWVAGVYIRWSLFLSSYVPLLLIFAVRLSEKYEAVAFGAVVAAALIALNLVILLNWHVAPRDFRVERVESGSNEVAGYIATYLLPFLTVGDMGWRDLLAYALLVWTVGQAVTRDDVLHINPLLSILRYRIYTITTVDGVDYYLIATRPVRSGDRVRAVPFLERRLLQR
jgi:hypothetical protein